MDSTMIFLISLWSMSSMPGRFRTTSEYLTTYMEGVLLMLCSYFTARTVWSYITIVLYHRWRARPRYSSCRWYRNVRNRNHRYLSVLPHRLYLSICIRSDVGKADSLIASTGWIGGNTVVWLSPKPTKTSYVHYEMSLIAMKYVLHARKIPNEFRMP